MTERICKTERFLREKLGESPYFVKYPAKGEYRLEHSFRVARIMGEIAKKEGMDEEAAVIAGLLHDVSYCREFDGNDDWENHGRDAARIARPFLESLELDEDVIQDILYGIAIHVDDEADFEGERTPFALTVGDADNIDRFDVYRLYETLEYVGYSKLSAEEKRAHAEKIVKKMDGFLEMEFATATAGELWRQRIGYYRDFYLRLLAQLDAGIGYMEMERCPAEEPEQVDRLMQLSGHF